MNAIGPEVVVGLGDRAYSVFVRLHLLETAGDVLAPYARNGRLVVVTDEQVWATQGERLAAGMTRSGIDLVPIIVSPGEGSKSWSCLTGLIDRLLELGVERDDCLIAFGGGVIGDLAGFAAAILKRGCPYVQVPTTLLAQVDSSVGGKTGINVDAGKNLVGAFHQPSAVLIDPMCLGTLSLRQLRAGYAEVVKYGLIGDPAFFAWCEGNGRALLTDDLGSRMFAIRSSVAAKAAIVAEDERESTGRRALLNFGHTFAHALEAQAGFSDRLLHGEAVALGMALAFRYSAERGLCGELDMARVVAHLASVGLPTELDAGGEDLVAHMLHDKKMRGGRVPFILTHGIGHAFRDEAVELDHVARFLDRQRAREQV